MTFSPLLSGENLQGPAPSSGFGPILSSEYIDAPPPNSFSAMAFSEELELQIVVPNHGPRSKQIRPVNNEGFPALEGQMLGVLSKPDWIDVYIDDLVVPTRADGRLTIGDGVSIADPSDVIHTSLKTSIHYVPYVGDQIALWDGSKWKYHTIPPFSEGGIATFLDNARDGSPIAASQNYDVYVYDNDGVLDLELVRWNDHNAGVSNRALAQAHGAVNGVLILGVDHTRRYVGTIRTAEGFAGTGNTFQNRYIWNWNNRIHLSGYLTNSSGAHITTAFTTSIPWGHPGFPDRDFPIRVVTGFDWPARAYFALIPRAFAQTGVTVTNTNWRCHNTIYLNSNINIVGNAKPQAMTIGVSSNARSGLAFIGTQKIATMFLPALWSGMLMAGYNFLQPMWAAEEIIQCFGCNSGDVATSIWRYNVVVELEQ